MKNTFLYKIIKSILITIVVLGIALLFHYVSGIPFARCFGAAVYYGCTLVITIIIVYNLIWYRSSY